MAVMETWKVLTDAFGRIGTVVSAVLADLDPDKLNWRPGGAGNSIAWLVWHQARIQDEQMAQVAGLEGRWSAGGYAGRFGFALDPADTGYGHDSRQVDAVQVADVALLREYHEAVLAQSLAFLRNLDGMEFDRIVDEAWDPPVTLGVRCVSIVDDCLQHAGQAAYVKGMAVELWRGNKTTP